MYSLDQIKKMTPEEIIRLTKSASIVEPQIVVLPLGNAFADHALNYAGNFVYAIDATDANVSAQIKFNRQNNPLLPLTKSLGYVNYFSSIFITSSAQANKTMTLLIAQLAPELFQVIDNRSEQAQTSILQTIADNVGDSDSEGLRKTVRLLDGDTGTAVNKTTTVAAGTTIVHTVTALKAFYLTGLTLSITCATAGQCAISVRNVADADQYYPIYMQIPAGGAPIIAVPFTRPIKIAAGWDVTIQQAAGALTGFVSLHGWEENA